MKLLGSVSRAGWLATAGYALVVALITGPWWLQPGYVWLLDSVWGPHPQIHWAEPTANLPWQIVVSTLTALLSGPIAEKLLLSLILLGIGLGGYHLGRRLFPSGLAFATGALYLMNPFVYERLAAGQWIVLAGYACLPVLLAAAWDTLDSQGRRGAYRLAALLAVYPLISQHYAYIGGALVLGLAVVYLFTNQPAWLRTFRAGRWLLATLALIIVVSSFWLWSPGGSGADLREFGATAFTAFRTAADPQFGPWGNVLSGYGFWRGSAFFSPKDFLPVWWLVPLIMLALAAAGALRAWRTRSYLGLTLTLAIVVAVVLAVGYATPFTRALTDALMQILPGYRGLRDTGKLVGVIMLALAVLAPLGVHWLTRHLGRSAGPWTARTAVAGLTLLATTSVTGIWGGYGGQVPVAGYPAGWYAVSDRLSAASVSRTVVLPWHGYLHLGFAHNTYAAQPAPVFFATPVLTSRSLDNDHPDPAAATDALDTSMISLLTGSLAPQDWVAALRAQGATHAVLFKTDDWEPYAQALSPALVPGGFNIEYDDPSVTLYRL